MSKSKTPETSDVVALSATLDNFYILDMSKLPIEELRAKCSFLISTERDDLKVGITFVAPVGGGAYTIEIAIVRVDFRGANRVPLNVVVAEFGVLQVYATVGMAARRFTQMLITWGEFKQAIQELAGGDLTAVKA